MTRLRQRTLAATVLVAACAPSAAQLAAANPGPESLVPRVDRVLAKVRARPLASDAHTPWVVLHGLIAFGPELRVRDVAAGESVGAVEYLLTRARHDGKRIFRERNGAPALPTRGRSYGLRQSFLIQDHVDQFLMVLGHAGVPLDQRIVAEGGRGFTVRDLLTSARNDFREDQELAWTLVAMAEYSAPAESWTNRSGQVYDVERILALALERDPRQETEGGPHHLYGVAFALRQHTGRGGKIDGVWAEAQRYLRRYASRMQAWQQPDGSFSGGVLRRNVPARGPAHRVSTTGHGLEWLALALSREELEAGWIARAVARLCDDLEQHPLASFSDGGLYHAAHALRRYREAVSAAP